MFKRISLLSVFVLSGCFSDTDEIKTFMADVQNNTTSFIAPMPKVPQFHYVEYEADQKRNPFVLPKPEAIQERMQQMAGCLSPDPRRRRQPLEKFPLDNLAMRGTLGELGVTWALIQASDNTLHRIRVGNYLGLYHGKVTEVSEEFIKVLELVPDGAGCWAERESTVSLANGSAEEQRN